jgi:hypothetical protein
MRHPIAGSYRYDRNEQGSRRRWLRRVVSTTAVAAVALLVTSVTAWADCGNTGSVNLDPATDNMSGLASWNAPNRFLTLEAVAAAGMSTDYCSDAWFDWTFQQHLGMIWGEHHFDARVARTCDPGSSRWAPSTAGWTEANPGVMYRFLGPHKLGNCRSNGQGVNNNIVNCGGMACATQAIAPNVDPNLPNPSTNGWTRTQDGATHFYSGGDPLSHNG